MHSHARARLRSYACEWQKGGALLVSQDSVCSSMHVSNLTSLRAQPVSMVGNAVC